MAAAYRAPHQGTVGRRVPAARGRNVAALSVLLVLLAAVLVVPAAQQIGSRAGHIGSGAVHHVAVTVTTRADPEQHTLHLDAALAATALVSVGLLLGARATRRLGRRPITLPAERGRAPPRRS